MTPTRTIIPTPSPDISAIAIPAMLLALVFLLGLPGDGTAAPARHAPFTQVVGGHAHSCALTSTGAVECWGLNNYGQLGNAIDTGTSSLPLEVETLDHGVIAIAAGHEHTCALTDAGAVKCWGLNSYGQLGRATVSGISHVPLDVQTLDSGVVAITAGYEHSCALTSRGRLKCWGSNYYGQLGRATNAGINPAPLEVQTLSDDVIAIAAGGHHTCALTIDGAVKCWGLNRHGQLGNSTNAGNSRANNAPLDVHGLNHGVTAISAGYQHTCALTHLGTAACWGLNDQGQLGHGSASSGQANDLPHEVPMPDHRFIALAAGNGHTCALTDAGETACWGGNDHGQLGGTADGNGGDSTLHTHAGMVTSNDTVHALAAGSTHTCALSGTGAVTCWGQNRHGQLGSNADATIGADTQAPATSTAPSPAVQVPTTLQRGVSIELGNASGNGPHPTFVTWTPQTCTVRDGMLTATAAGVCGVRARLADTDAPTAASQQLRLIRILPARLLTVEVAGRGNVDVSSGPESSDFRNCTDSASPCIASHDGDDARQIKLAATPANGWHLVEWSGACHADPGNRLHATVTLEGDHRCTANFAPDQHTITFRNWDGSTLAISTVDHGGTAFVPRPPTRPGWSFSGWDVPLIKVTGDMTAIAQFSIRRLTAGIWQPAKHATATNVPRCDSSRGPSCLTVGTGRHDHAGITGNRTLRSATHRRGNPNQVAAGRQAMPPGHAGNAVFAPNSHDGLDMPNVHPFVRKPPDPCHECGLPAASAASARRTNFNGADTGDQKNTLHDRQTIRLTP